MSASNFADVETVFAMRFAGVRRDEVVGVLLAFFLGTFGAHHFYLGRTGLGILYLCFFWTGIPGLLGVIECFFMPGRVRLYNAIQAAAIAAALGVSAPLWTAYSMVPPTAPYVASVTTVPGGPVMVACMGCGRVNPAGARFCAGCGRKMSA